MKTENQKLLKKTAKKKYLTGTLQEQTPSEDIQDLQHLR